MQCMDPAAVVEKKIKSLHHKKPWQKHGWKHSWKLIVIICDYVYIADEWKKVYFVLVDTPYPDDRVPSSSEEPIQSGV